MNECKDAPLAEELYGPEDWMWRVNRERVLLLAGPRALLLQLAHPLVAAGVFEFGHFQEDPLGRLHRTLDVMLSVIFGPLERGRRLAGEVNRLHAGIRGTLPTGTEHLPRGTPYSALDPDLLFWVHASLVDSALVAYQEFVGPLSAGDRAALHRESRRMAPCFHLPIERIPMEFEDFQREFNWMLEEEIAPTPEALSVARDVLAPPIRGVPRSLWRPARILTAGLLPARLRDAYGLPWSPARAKAYAALRATLRAGLPFLPEPLRFMPQARAAEARRR